VEQRTKCGILFICSLFYEYVKLEYVSIHVIYRVNQAEYDVHMLVVAPQEYVNIDSTHRMRGRPGGRLGGGVVWHLHDIVITNSVWCMAYNGRVGKSSCIAQTSCNSIAVVWAMQIGGVIKG